MNRVIQALKEGKEGIAIGALVGGILGWLTKDSVNVDIFSQSQGLLDTVVILEPTTKIWIVLAIVGAVIGFFIDIYKDKLRRLV